MDEIDLDLLEDLIDPDACQDRGSCYYLLWFIWMWF